MRKELGETNLDFFMRAIRAKEDGKITYDDLGDALLKDKNVYTSDNIRKGFYLLKKILPQIEEDIVYDLSPEEIERKQDLARKEIYKERVKLRDQRRELRKFDTSEARFEHLMDEIKRQVSTLDDLPYYKLAEKIDLTEHDKSATIMLSDWHAGAIIDNQFNFYNMEVLQDRANQVYNKVVKHGLTHKVRDLYVEINGDMVNGLIHVSSRVQSEEDVSAQIIKVSKVLANMINELKPFFGSITVITTIGNHGRMVTDKTANVTKENFEQLMAEILSLRLDDDIKMIQSGAEDFTKYNIGDKMICVTHGHYDKLNKIVQDFCLMYKEIPAEIHTAHRHAFKDMNECDVMVTVNGTLMGTDDYALSIRKNTKPSQTMVIYGEDRCVYNLIVE